MKTKWHLRTKSGKYPVCEMPPLARKGFVCGHVSRHAARSEAALIRATGRSVRVVRGVCEHAP